MSVTWTSWTQSAFIKFDRLMRTISRSSEAFGKKVRTTEWEEAIAAITWESKCRDYNRQRACKHLKGGKFRGSYVKDYAVVTHTFITGKIRVKCMLCGLEAWSQSGEDYKFAYMFEMTELSTNKASASEQPVLGVVLNNTIVELFHNIPGVEEKIKAKYPLWNGTVKPTTGGIDYKSVSVVYLDSVYKMSEEKPIDIGEDTNPIKGFQPATKLDESGGVLLV